MPRSRASDAKCDVLPPRSVTTPDTRPRMWPSAGPATRVTSTSPAAIRPISHSQLITTARPAPDPGGMPVQSRVPQPDLVGHVRRFQVQRSRLQHREPAIVDRPFDLDGAAEHVFG